MPDKPETLAETQARLAAIAEGSAPPTPAVSGPIPPPPVSAPIPSVSGPPGSPYGPSAPGLPDPAELTGATPYGTAATRPDPYAASRPLEYSATPFPAPAPTPVVSPRPTNVIALVLGLIAVLVIGAVVAFNVLGNPRTGSDQPVDEPVYAEEWQQFPGISYIDPEEALAQPSYEEVVAGTDELITEYRDALTAEFGFVWSLGYEPYGELESNGYGGDSMLYYYDTGSWQGQVQLDDPAARQRIYEIFTELSATNGGDGVLLRNELYSDDPELSRSEFGAEKMDDQALWSFFDSFPQLADGYLSSDVFDRGFPVDESFYGDYMFDYDETTDTLFVSVSGWSGGLLKEADRTAYEEALEPYHGDYEP